MTPLHWSTFRDPGKVENLLAAGADPLATLPNGKTILHMLYSPSGCSSCEADGRGRATTAESAGSPVSRKEIAFQIIEAGVNPDARDAAGASALHYAVMGADGVQGMISELLQLGASVVARDYEGASVSFYAALAGNTVAAKKIRLVTRDPVDDVDASGQSREEWVRAKREEMDRLRDSFEPKIITRAGRILPIGTYFRSATAGTSQTSLLSSAVPMLSSACVRWFKYVCTLMHGVFTCYLICASVSGPWVILCGAFCFIVFDYGCSESARRVCSGNSFE